MPIFFYIIKLSCSLALIWLFYRLLLRNLTFYDSNRWYLLGYSLLSFLIPLIDIGPLLEKDRAAAPLMVQFIPAIGRYTPGITPAHQNLSSALSVRDALLAAMLLGTLLMLIRLLFRWFSLRQLRRGARLISGTGVRIYQVDRPITPFSFGSAIYINGDLHSEKEWEEIVLHEYIHIRQRHTIDIILGEWLTILNWYNPFSWLIRHSIRQNLEFIADRKVLEKGRDKKDYQYHLLKVVGQTRYRLANNFNFSSLKKRIVMMNKLRSARLHLVRFAFILPLLAVLLVAFRDHYSGFFRRPGPVYVNATGIVLRLPGKSPLEGVTVHERFSGLETQTDANGYYKLSIPVTHDSVRVHLDFSKDGYEQDSREQYLPSLKETTGIIDIDALFSKTEQYHGIFIGYPTGRRQPADPSYADALAALKESMQLNQDAQRFLEMNKEHPEVALFYTSESRKQWVIHTDGSVERFGDPDGPTVADMEKKYGPLPAWSKNNDHPVNSGYLSRWASISREAEKDFHATGAPARAIIFPGDSRVIAVDASGKAQVYDMDNDDPKERPAFEKLYGKLPDCVPAGFHHPGRDTLPTNATGNHLTRDTLKATGNRLTRDSLKASDNRPTRDTLPAPSDTAIDRARQTTVHFRSWPPQPAPLIILDGVEMDTSGLRNLDPNSIASISVLKDGNATKIYGKKGQNGVILITSKKPAPLGLPGTPLAIPERKLAVPSDLPPAHP